MLNFKKVLYIINIIVIVIFVFNNSVYSYSQRIETLRVPSSVKDKRILDRMVQCVDYLASNHSAMSILSTRRNFLKTASGPAIAAAFVLGNVPIPAAVNSPLTAAVSMSSEQSNELLALTQILHSFRDNNGSPVLTNEKIEEITGVYKDEVIQKVLGRIDPSLFVESSFCERITRRSDPDKFLKILISSIVVYFDQDILPLIKKQPYSKQVEYGAWLYSSCLSTAFFSYVLFSARDIPGVHVARTGSHMFTLLSQENADIDVSSVSFIDIAMRNFIKIDSIKNFYEKAGKYYVLKKSKRIDPFNHPLGLALLRFKRQFIINNGLPVSQQGELSYKNIDSFLKSEGLRIDENGEEIKLLLLNGLYPCLQIKGQSDLISGLLQTIGNIYGDIGSMDKKRQMGAEIRESKAYERAIGFNPENSELFYNIGETFWLCFKASGDYREREKAIRYIAKAAELNPSNALAYYEIGRIYKFSYLENQKIKRGFNSPEELKKAVEQSDIKSVEAFNILLEGALLSSKASFEKAIEYDPCEWKSYIGLADIYVETGKLDEAITLCAKAIVLDGPKARKAMERVGIDKKLRKEAENKAKVLTSIMEENNRRKTIKEIAGSFGIVAAALNTSL